MDRRRAGNPGRRGYVVETPLPGRGPVINELEGVAPNLYASRRRGLRNARMNPEDEESKPRFMPELDRRYTPVENRVQQLKRGGTVNATTPKRKSKQAPARTKRYGKPANSKTILRRNSAG